MLCIRWDRWSERSRLIEGEEREREDLFLELLLSFFSHHRTGESVFCGGPVANF
jgi:hypothetical protein